MSRRPVSRWILLLLVAAASTVTATPSQSRTHRLEATPDTVAYGYYWSEAKPVLRVASGDIIDVDTLITNTPARLRNLGVPEEKIEQSLKDIVEKVTGDRRGPAAGRTVILQLDRQAMTSQFAPGIVIPLKPFFGSMGVAPAPEIGRVSSNPPGRHAGNLDNRELVAGSTLWIPIFVPGALFQVGDGHAAQGDGEVSQTAIETSLRGRLQLTLRTDMTLTWPRAETATDYITMATDPDLNVATQTAIQEMVDFLAATKQLTKQQAYQLTSIAGHVAITQLVDRPNMGVHVKIAKDLFK